MLNGYEDITNSRHAKWQVLILAKGKMWLEYKKGRSPKREIIVVTYNSAPFLQVHVTFQDANALERMLTKLFFICRIRVFVIVLPLSHEDTYTGGFELLHRKNR